MSEQELQDPVVPEESETPIVTDTSVRALQSADEVVENFFEGLDEDSFIAELHVVSAWDDGKKGEKPSKDSFEPVTNEADAPQEATEASSEVMSEAVKSDVVKSDVVKSDIVKSDSVKSDPVKSKPIPALIRKVLKKPPKGNVSNYCEKESALDRFKSFLPDGGDTEIFKTHANNKRYPNYVVPEKIDKEAKTDLGVRRDPDKTKRDIERDKQNKSKETLIKKMETGLIPPGMEMEIDNSSVAKRGSVKRKESPSPKRIKSRSKEENYRRRPTNDYHASRSRYYNNRSSNRSPSFSPDRNSRHDRRSSRSSRSSRNRSCERRSDRRSSPYNRDRSRIRPNKRSQLLKEMELLANTPVQYPVRAPAPAVTYPPPAPVPAPSYNPSYPAPPYTVENSFSIEAPPPIANPATYPNMAAPQDYYAPGYGQHYSATTFNPEVMPPETYPNSYVNNYTVPPPTDPAYAVGCNNYVQLPSSYTAAPATDGYSAYGNTMEVDKVIRDCEKVVAELNTPHLPTHVYPPINNQPQTETISEKINYSSPLNRNSTVNYSFTGKKNNVLLLPVIASTLEEKVGVKTDDASTPKGTRDVAVQTSCFSCDQCQMRGAFRQEDKSVNTMFNRMFTTSTYSQVTEEDLASSKVVFTPNQKAAAAEDPKPVSLTHMTPAQILADLKAKTKSMQRSLVDNFRQSGGKIEDFPAKNMNHRTNLYQKSNLLNHNKNHNSSWKN